MNIVNTLTLRQLKLNRKRTLVTIIGTIISVAMITAVATLGLSFMDLMQRQSIAERGEWHAKYEGVDLAQLDGISSDKDMKEVILSRELGYAYLEGSQNNNKPYLYINEYNNEGFKNFPIELMEGKLPEAENELVISEAVLTNAKVIYKIGDTIQLNIGRRRSTLEEYKDSDLNQNYSLLWDGDTIAEFITDNLERTYTIVGIIKRPDSEYTWSPGYTAFSYIDRGTINSVETFDLSVIFQDVNTKLFDKAESIGEKFGVTRVEFNNDLLRYYGVIADDSVKKMLFGLSSIIMIIIVIGSVSLIYNAFAISVSERSRYLGMLSSVGATKIQKRNSVFFEGAVIGIISIPCGIISGYVGLGVTFIFINPILLNVLNVKEGFRIVVYPSSLITAVLVSCITILISTYIPARRASHISAIDAIRQSMDYKMKGRQVRTLKLTRMIFGIEGDLGLKNLKRNRGRYKATVFSLIISMVLFLVVSAFTMYMKKSFVLTQDGINYDIRASISADNEQEKEDILQRIISLEHIKDMSVMTNLEVSTMIKETEIADYLVEEKDSYMVNGRYPYQIALHVLQEEVLLEYAKDVGVDMNSLTSGQQPTAIVIDTIRYKDYESDKYVETKAIKTEIGKQLDLSFFSTMKMDNVDLPSIKIVGLTNKRPMGIMIYDNSAFFHMIMSQEAFKKMIEGIEKEALRDTVKVVYLNSDKPLLIQESLEEIQDEYGMNSLNIFNVYYYKQQEEQAVLLVSVFTYAFILLITAICIANIINTISTSIALRKREFAMLKSVGMTPKSFNKMLNYESIFYGIKALIYGLPISFGAMYLIYRLLMSSFDFKFIIPMGSIIIVIIAVFVIVGVAMLYSGAKVKKENIIDALKQEII